MMNYIRGIGIGLGFLLLAILGLFFLGIIAAAVEIIIAIAVFILIILAIIALPSYLGKKKEVKSKSYSVKKIRA